MAGGSGSIQVERDKRGKSSKRKKKKRVGFHLDMTPLVDITFLLLTFFMFTTTMAQPQVMEMSIPPEVEADVEVKASQLMTFFVDNDNSIYLEMGMDEIEPVELKDVRGIAEERNIEMAQNADTRNKLITSLRVAKNADYGEIVNILDELNLAEIKITEETSKFTNEETGESATRERRFALTVLSEKEYEDFQEKLQGGGAE
jgi:biopolymer transport protein ExbD